MKAFKTGTLYLLYNVFCSILISLCFIGIYSVCADQLSLLAFNIIIQSVIITNYILSARKFALKSDIYSWVKLLLYEMIVILYTEALKTSRSVVLCVLSIVLILLITIVYEILVKTYTPQVDIMNRLVGRPIVFKIIFMLSILAFSISSDMVSVVYLGCIVFIFFCSNSIINYALAYSELKKRKDIFWCLFIDIVSCGLCILFTSYFSIVYPTESYSGDFLLFLPMLFTTHYIKKLIQKQ